MFIDQIEQRISVRTYQNVRLSVEDEQKIAHILEECPTWVGPFLTSIHPFYIVQEKVKDQEKIGTYGFVKNAPAFFGASTKNSKLELIDFGYLFEKLILDFTALNLGTVWLGGTFHRSQFESFIKDDLFIPAISPIGYEDSKSISEKLIRIAAKSNRRKNIEEFVYMNDFQHALTEDHQKWHHIFRYVQLAPSASNKQPWRFIVDKNHIHLYLERTPRYAEKLSYDIQYLDMGIAIYHLECAMKDLNISYELNALKTYIEHPTFEYIISFTII